MFCFDWLFRFPYKWTTKITRSIHTSLTQRCSWFARYAVGSTWGSVLMVFSYFPSRISHSLSELLRQSWSPPSCLHLCVHSECGSSWFHVVVLQQTTRTGRHGGGRSALADDMARTHSRRTSPSSMRHQPTSSSEKWNCVVNTKDHNKINTQLDLHNIICLTIYKL